MSAPFSSSALFANTEPLFKGFDIMGLVLMLIIGPIFAVAFLIIYLPPRLLLLVEEMGTWQHVATNILAVAPWIIRAFFGY